MKIRTLFNLMILVSLQAYAQTNVEQLKKQVQINAIKQLELYPQEKIYLHTDRMYYLPTEIIWFKAYVANALTHEYSENSRYVYVELINANNKLIRRVKLPPRKSLFHGNIALPKELPEGYYTLCAYTRYQENSGEDYLFKKKIFIGKLPQETNEENQSSLPPKTKTTTRQEAAQPLDYEVSFFPEGGNLLENVFSKVAFKALNAHGIPEEIQGRIIDESGEQIATVSTLHQGMGTFSLAPQAGKSYFLECSNKEGTNKRFQLPGALNQGHTLSCLQRDSLIYISKHHTAHINPNETFYLLAHTRGVIYHFDAWNPKKPYVLFSTKSFPAGIIQFILLDAQMNTLSERLFFCKNMNLPVLNYKSNKSRYATRDQVAVQLELTDLQGIPLKGSMSIAITDDRDIQTDNTSESILSRMLLTSELKGYIESPGYYFENDSMNRTIALDHLMLTHGWRRYNMPNVIKGNFEQPTKPFEGKKIISGQVKSLLLKKPVKGAFINILTTPLDFMTIYTDNEGRFSFNGERPDSTMYFIQAINKRDGKRAKLTLDEEDPLPELKKVPHPYVSSEENDTTFLTNNFLQKTSQRIKYDEYMRMVYLDEVEILANKKKQEHMYSGMSSRHLTREGLLSSGSKYLADILKGTPGVERVDGDKIYLDNHEIPALIKIDYLNYDPHDSGIPRWYDININTIVRVDLYIGNFSNVFGIEADGGAVVITTQQPGKYLENAVMPNQTLIMPLGHQRAIEFYSPQYDTYENKNNSRPDYRTTLYWKPDIITDDKGKATVNFYTSDFVTDYTVIIEGLSVNGDIIRKVEKIQIK